MKKMTSFLGVLVGLLIIFSSCTTVNHAMREPETRLNLTRSDFSLSEQLSSEAQTTKIIGIDWKRLFKKTSGSVQKDGLSIGINVASIPVLGNVVYDQTAGYALYEMMAANPGYDVVFYPQYETTVERPILGLGFIYRKTSVKATARLGKFSK